MGTRGAIVLVGDGTQKIFYNHYDSYPEGLGEDTLTWLAAVITPIPGPHPITREQLVRKAISELQAVDENGTPSEAQKAQLAKYHQQVSTGDDWYAWLRGTQGDLDATLAAGYYFEAGEGWVQDSLMCEWAYVIDFDQRVFEVYKGFQSAKSSVRGRFKKLGPLPDQTGRNIYYPVSLQISIPFEVIIEGLSTERFIRSVETKKLVELPYAEAVGALEDHELLKTVLAVEDEHTP